MFCKLVNLSPVLFYQVQFYHSEGSLELIVEEHIGALGHFVYKAHLEELVDNFEDKVLSVEVLELVAHPLVNVVERKTALRCL